MPHADMLYSEEYSIDRLRTHNTLGLGHDRLVKSEPSIFVPQKRCEAEQGYGLSPLTIK